MAKTNILGLTKTSWRLLEDVFWRRKARANIFVLIKTSWRRLLKTKTEDVFKTSSWRRVFAGLWLHLSNSLWGISLRSNVFRKRVDQKKFSTGKNLHCISYSIACIFFIPFFYFKFPDIPEKLGRTSRRTESWWQLRCFRFNPTNYINEIKITRPGSFYFLKRKLFIVNNHPDRFGCHRYSDSGGKMFLIYHVKTFSKCYVN